MTKAALQGRYDRVATVALPAPARADGARMWTIEEPRRPALPREGNRAGGKLRVKHAAVADPDPAREGKRQRVAVNMHTDALETEYAYRRISEEAYRAGRSYQAILEIARGRRTGARGFEPRDCAASPQSREYALLARLQNARDAVELLAEARGAIGAAGVEALTGVLGDGLTFTQMAARMGRSGERARREVARAFREGLEALARESEKGGALSR